MPFQRSLIWPLLLLILLPLAASWFAYPETHLPPGFGVFPPVFVQDPPGFNLAVFIVVVLAEAAIALLLFPQWFGFKPVTPAPLPAPARLPVWFWIGAVLTGFFWWLMWARVTPLGDLVYYVFTPLWWGFILMLDGIVYQRSGGYSLLACRTKTFLISALVSMIGWFFFEYYNYFALGNWGPMILMALSSLFNGFFWEIWNWGSAHPNPLPITNPNYWMYDVPYVNVIHLFSEMPLLGYFGYLPFGLLVWVMFIWAGRVFGFDSSLLKVGKQTSSGG